MKPTVFSRIIKGEITKKKIGLIFGIAAVAFFVMFGMTTDTSQPTQSNTNEKAAEPKQLSPEEQAKTGADAITQAEATKLLDASVQKIFSAPAGIQVINNEKNTWYGCKFVLNDKYKKQYNDDQAIGSGESESLTIPYAQFLRSDGTRFDYPTTASISFLISCNVNGNTRDNVYMF